MAQPGMTRNTLFKRWYTRIPLLYRWYEISMKREVQKHPIPQHVAIIMDGNRRFAKLKGEAGERGHKYGVDTTKNVLEWCEELRVKQLTLYSFSTENFNRTDKEKHTIFELMKESLRKVRDAKETHEYKLRITCVGDIGMLPDDFKSEIKKTEDATAQYSQRFLNVAVAYGGRKEILDSAIKIAEKVKSGELSPDLIDETTIDEYLYFPKTQKSSVDLIIRTGGDERTSNFLPWESSGNECAIYICAPFWPEFRKVDFLRAIRMYQIREREHHIKCAVHMIKLKKQNGGISLKDIGDYLRNTLNVSDQEIETVLKDPAVVKAMGSL